MTKDNVFFFTTSNREILTFASSKSEATKNILTIYPNAVPSIGLHDTELKYWQHELETSNMKCLTINDYKLMRELLS